MCAEDIKEIIEVGENQYVEFKREITSADDIASEIVAFLNSEGGAIYIGVEDNGNIIGVKDSKRLKERIVGISRNNCVPHFVPEFEDIKMGNLKIDINRSEIDLERILRNSQILTEKGEATLGGILLFSDNPGKYIFQ